MELNILGVSLSNTTEVSANPMELIAFGKKYALNSYEELMKKLNSNVGKLATSASIIGRGVIYGIATQGDKIAGAIQSAGKSLAKFTELPTTIAPYILIPEDKIMAMINGDGLKAPSNGTLSADVNPDGTYNI